MEPIKKIKKRIRNRNVGNLNPIDIEPDVEEKELLTFKGFLLKTVNRILLVLVLLIGFLIYAKNDPKAKFIEDRFGYKLDFTYVNLVVGSITNNILDFNIFQSFKNSEKTVSTISKYYHMGHKSYTNEDGKIYAIGNGKVALINDDDGNSTVVIRTTKEIDIFYLDVKEVFVSIDDWVDDGDLIGSFDSNLRISFKLNGVDLTYEEALEYFD